MTSHMAKHGKVKQFCGKRKHQRLFLVYLFNLLKRMRKITHTKSREVDTWLCLSCVFFFNQISQPSSERDESFLLRLRESLIDKWCHSRKFHIVIQEKTKQRRHSWKSLLPLPNLTSCQNFVSI